MNWVKSYRMDNDLEDEIYQFILNSHGESRNKSFPQFKRETRIDHLLDIESQEEDDLNYLNQFLLDFIGRVKVVTMPVYQYTYLDNFGSEVKPVTRNMSVQTYYFDSYFDLKVFLEDMVSKTKAYVFTYKMDPQPTLVGRSQVFRHTLRCSFVSDEDIESWKKSDIKTRGEHKW